MLISMLVVLLMLVGRQDKLSILEVKWAKLMFPPKYVYIAHFQHGYLLVLIPKTVKVEERLQEKNCVLRPPQLCVPLDKSTGNDSSFLFHWIITRLQPNILSEQPWLQKSKCISEMTLQFYVGSILYHCQWSSMNWCITKFLIIDILANAE